jgi:acyl-homoserine-lactone acylase
MPVPGLMDMIAATSSNEFSQSKVKAVSGDSYIMLIRYSDDGVEIETVLPYGVSTHKESPHFSDQMHMYVNQQRKRMTLDKDEIYKTAKRIYQPK